jgi:hypothetical protein
LLLALLLERTLLVCPILALLLLRLQALTDLTRCLA